LTHILTTNSNQPALVI